MDLERYTGMPEKVKQLGPQSYSYQSYMERSLERGQLDRAIALNDETVDYLYAQYTPTTTDYAPGTRPLLERVVDHVCADCRTDLERALKLVLWRRANTRRVSKCGLGTEEEILLGGYAMCHDAARCLVTLCQVAGLGARMVIGLNETEGGGHTIMEAYAGGRWMVLDPSPSVPFAFYRLPDGTYASARDLQLDPTIPSRCPRQNDADRTDAHAARPYRDARIVNYSLEESNRHMAERFVHMATAFKALENYDFLAHVNSPPVSSFVDLDDVAAQWLNHTVPVDDAAAQEAAQTTQAGD